MDPTALQSLLEGVRSGAVNLEDAFAKLARLPFTDIGIATVDHHRALRQGAPEVVFGEGKTPDEIVAISRAMVVGEIRSATSIAAGMAMLNGHDDIDLVLADWRLPDGDGLDFLRSVALRHPTVGRALMSGTDDPRLPPLCAAEGILGFLPKSLEPSDTILVLHRLLNGHQRIL